MSHTLMMMAQSPSCLAAVRAAKKKSPPPPPRKTQRQKPATTTTSHGFGGEKKTPVWQCVGNCGACCKLDKGPTFPSPEEIFEDPSDVETMGGAYTTIRDQENVRFMPIDHTSVELSRRFSIPYTGLTRNALTKKLAVVVQTLLKLFTDQSPKSWKISTVQYGAAVLNDASCKSFFRTTKDPVEDCFIKRRDFLL